MDIYPTYISASGLIQKKLTRLGCIAGAKYVPVEEEFPFSWNLLSKSNDNIVFIFVFVKII